MPSTAFLARFSNWVSSTPDAPALLSGDRIVSYAELHRMVEALRPTAERTGTGPVCVAPRKSPETVALVITCLLAGRQILLPPAELGSDALVELCAQAGCSHILSADGDAVRLAGGGRSAFGEPGMLLNTSGTTGRPKTVVLAADGVDRFIAWAATRFGIGPGRTTLSCVPLEFDMSLLDVWTALASGACVQLACPRTASDSALLAEACRDVDVVQASPMHFQLLTESTDRPFTAVRHAVFTGDAMPLHLLSKLPELFPRARLWNLYGSTETNDSFLHEVSLQEARAHGAVPIGRPLPGVDAVVADDRGAVVTGPGSGELLVSTPFQARGYVDQRHGGVKPLGRHFPTGDLVHRHVSGLLFLRGRKDDQVKVRGVRTNLHQVRQVILGHSDVVDALVTTTSDGPGGNRIKAAVRPRPGARLNSLQLRVFCTAKLPSTAVPSTVEIVDHALARTSVGKPPSFGAGNITTHEEGPLP
jgi:acyl-coenzyme A synthetase/AMP-(fatty) acid ligase